MLVASVRGVSVNKSVTTAFSVQTCRTFKLLQHFSVYYSSHPQDEGSTRGRVSHATMVPPYWIPPHPTHSNLLLILKLSLLVLQPHICIVHRKITTIHLMMDSPKLYLLDHKTACIVLLESLQFYTCQMVHCY
jgi:hypothetical protein